MGKHIQVPMYITYEELAEALKSVRLWVRLGDMERSAWQMKVLHPEDAANDLFISAAIKAERRAERE